VSPRIDVTPFNDIRVRKAMQMAIDLPSIAKDYYAGTALPYPSSMTTSYMKGWGWPYEQWPQALKDEYAYNPTAAKKLLAEAGYPSGFKTNVAADATGDLDLLQIIKSYFADVGITMEIRPMDAVSWNSFVRITKKYDQLSYRSNGSLGMIFEPMTQLTQFQTGNASNYYGISDPAFDAFYPKALAATKVDDIKQVVRDANENVARQHYLVTLLQPTAFGLNQPWLKGFNYQVGAIGGTSGPFFLDFYAARFWIDKDLKKSLGH
jgi:ABC-type transport system substrate-binding protein